MECSLPGGRGHDIDHGAGNQLWIRVLRHDVGERRFHLVRIAGIGADLVLASDTDCSDPTSSSMLRRSTRSSRASAAISSTCSAFFSRVPRMEA